MVRELIGVIRLKKYRTMKKRYSSAEEPASIDAIGLWEKSNQ